MKRILNLATFILLTISLNVFSQSTFNYELSLVPVTVTNLPGLHSYAYAQNQGKWLIIGGRKDGLHARQPFNAFPASQNNTDICDKSNDKNENRIPINIFETFTPMPLFGQFTLTIEIDG